jgi:GH25 family lysozyme M1 (1,4-beta-N-acetylmuramidase)
MPTRMLWAMRSFVAKLISPILVSSLLVFAACGPAPVREDEVSNTGETADAVRACAGSSTVHGIDVSGFQGSINWGDVARDGKAFAIMKATEGTGFTDSTFARNWANAKNAGVIRGAYHFFHPALDPIAQANHFVDVMGPLHAGDLPPMLDLEITNGLSAAHVAASARAFLQHVEARTGRRPLIYTGYFFWRDQVGDPSGFSQYPLVMAAYVSGCPLVPNSWGHFTMWQYSDSGRVSGIAGNVDLDVFNGDMKALRALAGEQAGPPPPAPTGCGVLAWGKSLTRGESHASCGGRFTFVHQTDGNVVLYDNSVHQAMWATHTNGRSTSVLAMQEDGNLVLYAPGGHAIWASGTNGKEGAYLVVQDDGNTVIYAPGHSPIWATHTVRGLPPTPGCGLRGPPTVLTKGEGVHSCDGRFFFVHQGDGNVVLYDKGKATWASDTSGRATESLVMQSDGNLVLYAPNGHALWATGTHGHPGAFLAIQEDGNSVIYTDRGQPLWSSHTRGK